MLKNHLDRQDSHFRSWRGICFEYGYGFEDFCVIIFVYTKHTIRKSTYSYRNAAALIPNKNRYTTPLSLYYSPPNGIFSMLFLSLNSSLEYCFTLPDIRGMFIPGKKRIGLCRLPTWTLRSLEEHKKMLPDSYRLHGG